MAGVVSSVEREMMTDRQAEDRLAEQLEADAFDEDAWIEDAAPEVAKRTLGAQVTLRLDADKAEEIRRVAARRGVGYTSLIRVWVEERLADELRGFSSLPDLVVAPQTAGEAASSEERFTTGHGRAVLKAG